MGTLNSILSSMHSSLPLIKDFRAPWILIQGGLDKAVDVTLID